MSTLLFMFSSHFLLHILFLFPFSLTSYALSAQKLNEKVSGIRETETETQRVVDKQTKSFYFCLIKGSKFLG